MELFWFIPSFGDGRYPGTATGGRAVTYPYLGQIAQAVDHLWDAGSEHANDSATARAQSLW